MLRWWRGIAGNSHPSHAYALPGEVRGTSGERFLSGHLSVAMGGNVCSEGCAGRFFIWIKNGPNALEICPGHGGQIPSIKDFGSWPDREHAALRLERDPSPTVDVIRAVVR